MTDDELEKRLRAHYREIDPGVAPRGLGVRIDGALDRRRGRSVYLARMRPAFAAGLAAVVIVAVGLGLGLRPGGFLAAPGASPAPSPSAQPSAVSPEPSSPSPSAAPSGSPSLSASPSASPSESPSPTPTIALPSGSVPPVSPAAWTGLHLQAIEGGPVGAWSVVPWSGGYVALGLTSDRGALPAWLSRDGRSWVTLPTDTFGPASSAMAAPCVDGVLVAVQSRTGDSTAWRSADGVTWTSSPAPPMRFGGSGSLAGGPGGAVAILEGYPYRIAFSADCVTWQTVSLPGDPAFSVQGVAALGSGFVAVGDAGTPGGSLIAASPVAWWSSDGLQWTLAHVQAYPGAFQDVHSGRDGLAAFSTSGGTPGLYSFWTSPDGRTWTVSTANPLGVCQPGDPGVCLTGSANGAISGDETRLLGYGNHAADPTEYWVSFDATHWTRLALAGDTAAALAPTGGVRPFLLRDGVLFSGDQGSWFGSAVK